MRKINRNYNHYLSSERDVFLYVSSFSNALKSMAFRSGCVQKNLDTKHLFRHSAISPWIMPYLITCPCEHLPSAAALTNLFYLEPQGCSHS